MIAWFWARNSSTQILVERGYRYITKLNTEILCARVILCTICMKYVFLLGFYIQTLGQLYVEAKLIIIALTININKHKIIMYNKLNLNYNNYDFLSPYGLGMSFHLPYRTMHEEFNYNRYSDFTATGP